MHIHTIQLKIEKIIGGTGHMDATEFGAYMSLIVAAYQSKNKLPLDDHRLARMARVTGHKWGKIKDVVLDKFINKGTHYEHDYIKDDLQRMKSLSKKNRENRLQSLETSKESFEDKPLKNKETNQPVVNENVTNINIQYPISTTSVNSIVKKPDDVDDYVWQDFVKLRKKKKADITETALTRIRSQADAAGWSMNEALAECVTRGWMAFKAEWVANKERQGHVNGNHKTKSQRADDAAMRLIAEYENE